MVTLVMASPSWLTTTRARSPGAKSLSCSREPLSMFTPVTISPAKAPSSSSSSHSCSPERTRPVSMMALSSVDSTRAEHRSASW